MPLITNDAIAFGLLMITLAGIFTTANSSHPFWKKLYTFVPSLLLCYFIPSIYSTLGWIDPSSSQLYYVASRYLLPASLVLLTLSIDLKAVLGLGWKAIAMFLTGTIGIVIGGPLAMLIVGALDPSILEASSPDNEIWRGLATVAGSWIGGGANQTAMLEVYQPSSSLFSAMVTVDIIMANLWLAFLLYGASMATKVDQWLGSDTSAITHLREQVQDYQDKIKRIPSLSDLMSILAVAFGITAIGHIIGDNLAPWITENAPKLREFSLDSAFFWIVVTATTGGLLVSFTKLRTLEGAGASKVGSLFLYILVMTIGLKMDLMAFFEAPGFFLIGLIWILMHVALLLIVAKLIKAPLFFVAVGSQANVGGAASAPIVASAFHPALAPVGVLLAVLGYALGTYGAYATAEIMRLIY
ncbi:MAG: hypothetical protein CNE38_03840 [Rhodothermaeota bacterium MED-G12]|jgi:uncharacterized membrane protein|nr:DUF819 family protein [Balneolaceae bacterium]PDH55799.1 MAG: hypothetical protein CNE38_03840 [Rhodothermaeota bacterium MED-G12]CAI8286462.1 MAG: Uncharacterised protein [Rhodothermaeota bacterium MED-G12]|tara:strand:- start:6863 stop:8101 length:1239 start_codon:yes stop_codon:yes gene_type:complete